MAQPNAPRGGLQLENVATLGIIVVCALASLWLGRDLAYGGGPPPVRDTAREAGGVRPPVRPPPPPLPKEPVSIAGAALKGSAQAKVALVIFSDFECAFCARFANDTWPGIDSKYVSSGKVRAAFRHLPIDLGGHLKTGNLSTGQNRQFCQRPETGEFYFVTSSVRKSAWTLVRQLRGPHLSTCP